MKDESAASIYIPFNIAALVHHALRQYENEEQAIERCIERGFDTPELRYRQARCQLAQDDFPSALEAVDKGLAVDPENISLQSFRIHLLRRSGDTKRAQALTRKLGAVPSGAPSSYLLTWNPTKFRWFDLHECAREAVAYGTIVIDWSCGRTKRIAPGDRVYLLRQGKEPKGLMASGRALSGVVEGKPWNPTQSNVLARYVIVEWDALLDPAVQPLLHTRRLKADFPSINWNTQISGITIEKAVASRLEKCWDEHIREVGVTPLQQEDASLRADRLAEEVVEADYREGSVKRISVNAYERNPAARKACIAHYGAACAVCGLRLEKVYGAIGRDYIHVHHIKPLSDYTGSRKVDPVQDLRPVCPNCHAMIHRQEPPLTINELKRRIQAAARH